MKYILIPLLGIFLICLSCNKLQTPIDPDNTKEEPADSTRIPVDSIDVPVDTVVVDFFDNSDSVYHIVETAEPVPIDGNWEKSSWEGVQAIELTHFLWEDPKFRPHTEVKMCYDQEFIYVIFQVKDQYVKALATQINGNVWEDAAVELFFAPDTTRPLVYFNLEINCIGTPLMFHIRKPMSDYLVLDEDDIKTIEISSSLEGMILEEITDPITWTLEYRIPLATLEKYTRVDRPEAGVIWKANFYKIATNNSNNHYVTWSTVKSENPNFHLPEFFGKLVFH